MAVVLIDVTISGTKTEGGLQGKYWQLMKVVIKVHVF
jgi:hypothetical protein